LHGQSADSSFQFAFKKPETNWEELKSGNGIKFSNRHAHASCMYTPPQGTKPRMWVVGGKVEYYQRYDMVYSYKQGDVWWSEAEGENAIGANWQQEQLLTGDFYAQNADVIQPGKIAPFYQRFGHTLTAYDSDGDGKDDMMLLMGGFAPQPMNDIWVTENGIHWTFHESAWGGRGWHSTVVNNGTLYVLGGSPLNSEVWRMDSIEKVNRTNEPLSRASFSPYTYKTKWTKLTAKAPWCPRGGMGVMSQWYWNYTQSNDLVKASRDTVATTAEGALGGYKAVQRMVLVGGFGGNTKESGLYDGYVTRGDVWTSVNGSDWELMNDNAFSGRAWFGYGVFHMDDNPKRDVCINSGSLLPPRMWIFGGGFTGGFSNGSSEQLGIIGATDALWSRDGVKWTKVNYDQGAGTRGSYDTYVKFFSSQEWSKTLVDGKYQYLGLWGQSLERSNNTFILIAGDKTGAGTMTSSTYQSKAGLLCDINGNSCNSPNGACGDLNQGCVCVPGTGLVGEYCDQPCSGEECDNWPPTD